MQKREHKLEEAFFPVKLVSIYAANEPSNEPQNVFLAIAPEARQTEICGFKALTRELDGRVYAVVSDSYRPITNEQAYELGKMCFAQVFGKDNAESMVFHNLRMP